MEDSNTAKSVAISQSIVSSHRNLIGYIYSIVLASKFLMSYSLNIGDENKSLQEEQSKQSNRTGGFQQKLEIKTCFQLRVITR